MSAAPKYPEYDRDANFRCAQGCGTFERQNCRTHRGCLICPRCRYIGTLRYVADVPASRDAGKGGERP